MVNHRRIMRRVSAGVALSGVLLMSLPMLARPAAAIDINDDGPFAGNPSVGGPCGTESLGLWMRFATGGSAGTFVRQSTGQSPPATLVFEQTATNPPKFRIVSLLNGLAPATFGGVIVFNGGNNGRVFNFATPISNTGGDFLNPQLGGPNSTHLLVCGYPATAAFTVTKTVTYPDGSVPEATDPTTFAMTISCLSAASTGFNWASLQTANLTANQTTATVRAPTGTTCTATDSSPLFTTSSAPSTLVLDTNVLTTQSITVTNAKKPTTKTLTVTKVVVGTFAGDPDQFPFTVTCAPGAPAPSPSTFLLGDGEQQVVTVPTGSTCTVVESVPDNFTTTVTGDDADGVRMVMDVNKSVTFTNTRELGDLTITKVRVGGSSSDVFGFDVDCGNDITRTGTVTGSGQLSFGELPTGVTCAVSEQASPNYNTEPSSAQEVFLEAGVNNVTFTNTRKLGSLNIAKIQNGGSASDTFNFTYSCGASEPTTVTLLGGQTSVVLNNIPTSTSCTVTETEHPLYTTAPSLSQTLTIAQGTNTATFTNTRRTAGLTIVKVRNGGLPTDRFDFSYNCGAELSGTVTIVGAGSANPVTVAPVGTLCTVTEIDNVFYETSPSLSQQTTIARAGSVVTFTNTRRTGNLSIAKVRVGGESNDQFNFAFECISAANGTITIVGGGTQLVGESIPTGTVCTVTENAHGLYATEPGLVQSVTVAEGINTVTFTNTRRTGSIAITKVRSGGSPLDTFTFDASCVGFGRDGIEIVGAGTQTIISGVPTGTVCTVSEEANDRYTTTPSLTQTLAVVEGVNNVMFTNTLITADLGIDKTGTATILAGEQFSYTVVVTNHGSFAAVSPIVADVLPAGTTFVSLATTSTTPAGLVWTCTTPAVGSAGAVSCSRLSLAAGASTTFTLRVAVSTSAVSGSVLSNTATVTSSTPEPSTDTHPNTDTATTAVATLASITIRKTSPVTAVAAGAQLAFTIEVTNFGPSDAADVVITDPVPVGLVPVVSADSPCNAAGTQCSVGSLNVGQTKAVVVRYQVPVGYVAPTVITNTATVTSPTDPTPSSASASVGLAALSIEKAVATTPAPPSGGYRVNDVINFQILIRNIGGAPLTSVRATELVETATLTTCSTGATQAPVVSGGYNVAVEGVLRCNATHVVTQAEVDNASFTNRARATSDQTAPSTADVLVRLPGNPSINIVKSVTSTGPYSVGSIMTFTLVASNNGTVTLTAPSVMEQLDAQLSECAPPAQLAPGESFTCIASHTVTAADMASQQYSNTATATAIIPGGGESVVDETTLVVVTPSADLSIVKTLVGNLSVGGTATFSLLVANAGPSVASGITVIDDVGSGISITSASGSGWVCDVTASRAVCSSTVALDPGAALPPITVVATITAAAGGQVSNSASITSTHGDPNLTNNRSSISDIVPAVLSELPGTGSRSNLLIQLGLLLTLVGSGCSLLTLRRP